MRLRTITRPRASDVADPHARAGPLRVGAATSSACASEVNAPGSSPSTKSDRFRFAVNHARRIRLGQPQREAARSRNAMRPHSNDRCSCEVEHDVRLHHRADDSRACAKSSANSIAGSIAWARMRSTVRRSAIPADRFRIVGARRVGIRTVTRVSADTVNEVLDVGNARNDLLVREPPRNAEERSGDIRVHCRVRHRCAVREQVRVV